MHPQKKIYIHGKLLSIEENPLGKSTIQDVCDSIQRLMDSQSSYESIFVKNMDATWQKITNRFKIILAAGGLVFNASHEILFIYRLGKWDLPKGKIEPKESSDTAALREIEEETGVSNLKIIDVLPDTFHMYPLNDVWILKITAWYLVKTDFKLHTKPQIEEGIEEVKWLPLKQIDQVLGNTYPNIKDLFTHVKNNPSDLTVFKS